LQKQQCPKEYYAIMHRKGEIVFELQKYLSIGIIGFLHHLYIWI